MIFKYTFFNFLLFLLVFTLQIIALNNVSVFNVGFPMIYPMLVILLPIRQPVFVILIAAFFTGLSIDFFANTGGLHAAALTFMGFVRIAVLNKLEPQAEYGKEDTPGLRKFGWRWMLIYTSILILAHHFSFFLIEESSLAHIGEIILKTIVSSILSFILMMTINTLIFRR
jgi:hypothetical protein